MSIALRPSQARGHAVHGWLDSYHTFSFADYYDPAHMGYRALRVINDDVIKPANGFGTHPHRDMEIVTYMVRGTLAHQDTTGAKGALSRGDVQAMSAGSGILHSEINPSRTEEARLLQIWILPAAKGLPPTYGQTLFPDSAKHNRLRLLVAPDGVEGALPIHQDVRIYASLLDAGASVDHALAPGRGAWIQVVGGTLTINGSPLAAGDGAAVDGVDRLDITAGSDAEFLLFDLA